MKPKEAIKILKGTLSLIYQTDIRFEDAYDYRNAMQVAIVALENQDKCSWHDLRKNPTFEKEADFELLL